MISTERLASYLDNTAFPGNYKEQGVLAFLKDWFPDRFYNDFAFHHYQMTKIFWEMQRPDRQNRFERQGYFVVHREAAKTTLATFGFPQYLIWLRSHRPWVRYDAEGWEGSDLHNYEIVQLPPIQENLIVICSETSNQSKYFVANIKDTLDTREDLAKAFGQKEPKAFVAEMEEQGYDASAIAKNKWTNDAFITADGTVVVGKGAGQQIRGLNIRGSRPTTIFVDDMYSRNNTKTENRLEDLNRWFYAELSNSLDGAKGKLFFLGTVVHDQTVIQDIMVSDQWFGVDRPIIGYEELQRVLKDHCTFEEGKVIIPSKERCKQIQQRLKTLSWPDKHDLFYILSIYKREYEQARVAYFYQEYLNITQAPEESKFDRSKLKPVRFRYEGHLMVFDWDGRTWYTLPETHLGIDLASSAKVTADHTVIAGAGLYRCKSHRPGTNQVDEMIVPMIPYLDGDRGWGIYEELRDNIRRRGVVDEVVNVLGMHRIQDITIEINGQQVQTKRELDAELYRRRIMTTIYEHTSESRKQDRILSIMVPIFNRYAHIFYDERHMAKIETMYTQLTLLGPTDTKDDYADGTSIAFMKAAVNPLDFNIPGFGYVVEESHRIDVPLKGSHLGSGLWEAL